MESCDEDEIPTKKCRIDDGDVQQEEEEEYEEEQTANKVKDSNSIVDNEITEKSIDDIKRKKVEEPGIALDNQLRKFHVLDEVQGDGTGTEDESGDDGDSSGTDLDIDADELENLLDEGLPDDLKSKKKPQYEERFKPVLEEKGKNHFEVLPEGWVQVTHHSGIPLFLHKTTRVCTLSRPYFLGPGSARKHEIPLSAIPCLSYRKALDKEKEEAEKAKNDNLVNGFDTSAIDMTKPNETTNQSNTENDLITSHKNILNNQENNNINTNNSGNLIQVPRNAKIETVKENLKAQSLTANEVNEYCRRLFHFKTIRVMRFKSWSARRKFNKSKKHIKNLQRPTLPEGTKLITFPILSGNGEGNSDNNRTRREWIMNPNGKSYVCILHEYLQHAFKKQPCYEFKELENAATPYFATVTINGLRYGAGYGTSKKQAKSEAARETLEILIPEMKDKITADKAGVTTKINSKDLSIFDEIKIEDPRVAEFCKKTTEPSPHAILLTCLQRNFGLGDIRIKYEVSAMRHKKNQFTMEVGKHTATVSCKNKREGKQLASQAILQILHPHIKTWGSLLRLYGNHSVKTYKEKKQEEQEITVLQSKAAINQPNYAILDKLKYEMLKLSETKAAVQPIGTFIPPNDVDLPISSGSNLNNVEL